MFEVQAGSGTITTLASFNGTNGEWPIGGLVEDSSGNLFGTTEYGGAKDDGTVFEVQAGSGTIATLASFNGTDGAYPETGLVEDSSGNLFGTTGGGGSNGDGTVFEVQAGTGIITTLASFNAANGEGHWGVVEDSSGNLFGTTVYGGAANYGTVFEVQAGSGTITTLASFQWGIGAYPEAGLVVDSSGNLFGTTYAGGATGFGTVFEVQAGSGTITTLASFNVTYIECEPYDPGLVEDSSGNLFGTTYADGGYLDGTVFEVQRGSGTITTLATFNGTNRAHPWGLVEDSSGNLFGTTGGGGAIGCGTVFEIGAAGGQTVTLPVTSTILTSACNPSVYGQTVTFTATVSGTSAGAGTPTGTVTFEDGGAVLSNRRRHAQQQWHSHLQYEQLGGVGPYRHGCVRRRRQFLHRHWHAHGGRR